MDNTQLSQKNRERLQTMLREKHLKRPILKRTVITQQQRTHFAAWFDALVREDIASVATVRL